MSEPASAPLLRATYRVQLHGGFTLADARALVPYLAQLGISHLYCSPVLRSQPGSTHGYDVIDPSRLDPELGSDADWDALHAELRAHAMGLLLDIVPNHMGVGGDNPFLDDLFASGAASRYASWFDIDWDAPQRGLRGRVLVPVLGDRLDAVIARGEIALRVERGRIRVRYADHSLPIDPALASRLLTPALDSLRAARAADDADVAALERADAAFLALPPRSTASAARVERRQGDVPVAWRAFEDAYARPSVRAAVDAALLHFVSGATGHERLRSFLDSQVYALGFWRRAADEINYRRFFDVNELVALRMEDPAVFGATHRRILEWVKGGSVNALRVDHIDGLLDPRDYLERLRGEVGDASAVPLFVEKILAPDERLRRDWPVQGTTGYEFLAELERIFVDPAGYAEIERGYRELAGRGATDIGRGATETGRTASDIGRDAERGFAEVARRAKALVLRTSLRSDVERLVRRLVPIAAADPRTATATPAVLRAALVELLVAFPVYRTYVEGGRPAVAPEDRRVIEIALRAAAERMSVRAREREASVLALLGDVLLLRGWEAASERERSQRLRFVQRFQQTSAPAAAKGVEDTAFYRYVPLVSLNDVGGDPGFPVDGAVEALHARNAERARDWPQTLLALSTHDTKRSADARARLDVLSEMAGEWLALVRRWQRDHRRFTTRVRARRAPDSNTAYLFYESAVAIWPAEPAPGTWSASEAESASDARSAPEAEHDALRSRLRDFMLKAAREAKVRTSWANPDEPFERALMGFIDALLDPTAGFVAELENLVRRIAPAAAWNSLSRRLVQLTAPGVPDIYQGDEIWNYALVDPDNRRPVDFALRERLLDDALGGAPPDPRLGTPVPPSRDARGDRLRELVSIPGDPRLPLMVVHAALAVRAADPRLFVGGAYEALRAVGPRSAHVFAFGRIATRAAITVVARLTHALGAVRPWGTPDAWAETCLELPPALRGQRWRCALTGLVVSPVRGAGGSDLLQLGDILAVAPVSLLVSEAES